MSNEPVTMAELELERADLLPSRETLCVHRSCGCGFSFTQVGFQNAAQSGLINVANIAILSGNVL
jgi:hypothetical protein